MRMIAAGLAHEPDRGARIVLPADGALKSVHLGSFLFVWRARDLIPHPAYAANDFGMLGVKLNEPSQTHDQVIDGARVGVLILGPDLGHDFVAAHRFSATIGE